MPDGHGSSQFGQTTVFIGAAGCKVGAVGLLLLWLRKPHPGYGAAERVIVAVAEPKGTTLCPIESFK